MKACMIRLALVLALLTGVCGFLTARLDAGLWLTLTISFGTFLYHILMRLLVGTVVDVLMHNHADVRRPWFQPRSWEPRLYARLRVKRWKAHLPTFQPERFDLSLHSPGELAQATCQAEIVHEIIAVLSFLPLAAAIWLGAFPIFLVTSLLAAALDLCFVAVQRFNRPRFLRLMQRKSNG